MMYVGIDQHKRHLTICIRDEQGNILVRRQVSTEWSKVISFLEWLKAQSKDHGGFAAVIEVCGFNGWLIDQLKCFDCQRVYLIAPPPQIRQKTDRRDAARLSELLWINRYRIAAEERLVQISAVYQPTPQEQYDRQLTHLRHRLGGELTRVKNSIQGILRRHNQEQECPAKGMFTQKGLRWLKEVQLPEMDQVELDTRLEEYELHKRHLDAVKRQITARAALNKDIPLLRTLHKLGVYTALALSAHIGPVERFPKARSLANFFGLTPGCRNSGQSDRPGSITKAGHPFVRFLLGQAVLQALRSDPGLRKWYRGIKRRRGSKIARVAVMRRMCEALWHMLRHRRPYQAVNSMKTMPPSKAGEQEDRPKAA